MKEIQLYNEAREEISPIVYVNGANLKDTLSQINSDLSGKAAKEDIANISLKNAFKSTVFCRQAKQPDTPTGGNYSEPWPTTLGWSDGVPAGNDTLWASTRIFYSDDSTETFWTQPNQMSDKVDFDIAFSSQTAKPEAPSDHPNVEDSVWKNTADETTIWMATSTYSNGGWSEWQIAKIKGEKGDAGTSIKVQGSYDTYESFEAVWIPNGVHKAPDNQSDCYVVDQNLYVWDGDSWHDAGKFKGDSGKDGKSSYLYVKYANLAKDGDTNTFTYGDLTLTPSGSNGDDPGNYIGTKVGTSDTETTDYENYTWVKWKGEDGFGYEYIYILSNTAPAVPTDIDQTDDFVPESWSDNPLSPKKEGDTILHCWICTRQKVGGIWQSFKGDPKNEGYASLYTKYTENGEKGDSALSINLLEDSITVPCYSDGTLIPGDHFGAGKENDESGQGFDTAYELNFDSTHEEGQNVYVYYGTQEITSEVTFSVVGATGLTYTLYDADRYIDVMGFDETNPRSGNLILKAEHPIYGSISIRFFVNKAYSGNKGESVLTSFVFCRTEYTPDTPVGGTFDNPWPNGTQENNGTAEGNIISWSDSPTDATNANQKLYMSEAVFNSVTHKETSPTWSQPMLMADTATLDIQWCKEDVEDPGTPDNPLATWIDEEENAGGAIWMAMKRTTNGISGDWVITRVKGEKGNPGTFTYYQLSPSISQLVITDGDITTAEPTTFDIYVNKITESNQEQIESLEGYVFVVNWINSDETIINGYSKEVDGTFNLNIPTNKYVDGTDVYLPSVPKYLKISLKKDEEVLDFEHIPVLLQWSQVSADIPDWVTGWSGEATEIGDNKLLTGKIYAGAKPADSNKENWTGILIGNELAEVKGLPGMTAEESKNFSGILGLSGGNLTGSNETEAEVRFALDAETGDAYFKGEVHATEGVFENGQLTTCTITDSLITSSDTEGVRVVYGEGSQYNENNDTGWQYKVFDAQVESDTQDVWESYATISAARSTSYKGGAISVKTTNNQNHNTTISLDKEINYTFENGTTINTIKFDAEGITISNTYGSQFGSLLIPFALVASKLGSYEMVIDDNNFVKIQTKQ